MGVVVVVVVGGEGGGGYRQRCGWVGIPMSTFTVQAAGLPSPTMSQIAHATGEEKEQPYVLFWEHVAASFVEETLLQVTHETKKQTHTHL